jgi:hypothetical protein
MIDLTWKKTSINAIKFYTTYLQPFFLTVSPNGVHYVFKYGMHFAE